MNVRLRGVGLCKSYRGIAALQDANIVLESGRVHGLVGPNGAGKSTLVKLLCGVERVDEGLIEVEGKQVHFANPSEAFLFGISAMPQELHVFPNFKVWECVLAGHEPSHFGLIDESKGRGRVSDILDRLGIVADLNAPVSSLSATEQRLMMLAQALARRAKVVILDEPTAGIGANEARTVIDAVVRLAKEDVAVLYVSHQLEEVTLLCDEVTAIREGHVVAHLKGDQINSAALVGLLLDVEDGGEFLRGTNKEADYQDDKAEKLPDAYVKLDALSGGSLIGVSAGFARNGMCGLAGTLGSGVEDLVEFLIGSRKPSSGSITIGGKPCVFRTPRSAIHSGIGYITGKRTRIAFTDLSVRENVTISGLRKWTSYGLIRRRSESGEVQTQLRNLGVSVGPEQRFGSLSGGNQQRVLLIRWLASVSEVLILDDPTVGVDIKARSELWSVLQDLAHSRMIIIASNDIAELTALCDRVICFRAGKIVAELSGQHLTERAITEAIQLSA